MNSLFEKTGARPETSIMLGDHLEADIMGAKNAGMDQVFVNHVGAEVKFNPTYVVYALDELKEIF